MSTDAPTIAMQAGAVRHITSTAPDNLRPALEAAARTLDYHAAHPAIMKAVAYFEKHAPEVLEIMTQEPGAKIAAINMPLEEAPNDGE